MMEAELYHVSQEIRAKIDLLVDCRNSLRQMAVSKADAIAEYDKALAVAIIRLKDSGKYPATLIEKIAKGECSKERAQAELSEAQYKLTITKINAIQAELNGYQSIYKHLDIG